MFIDRLSSAPLSAPLASQGLKRLALAASLIGLLALTGCPGGGNIVTLSVTKQPASVTVQDGQSATFSAAAESRGSITVQWLKDGRDIVGATATDYTVTLAYADNGSRFSAVFRNDSNGAKVTADAIATVLPTPIVFAPPSTLVVSTTVGGSVSLSNSVVSGSLPRTHQWLRNGLEIAGATQPQYLLTNASLADNGAQFNLAITNPVGRFTSFPVVLTVTP